MLEMQQMGTFSKDCRQGRAVAVVGAVEDQSMKNVGQQVTKVEVCSDQATGSNERKGVMIDSQHKQEVVKPKMCTESLTGSNECTGVIIDNLHKCEVVEPKRCVESSTGSNECTDGIIDSQRKCEFVESKMCLESSMGSKHKGDVMGSLVRRRGPRCPRRQTRQGTRVKVMVGKAEPTSNPPLWVNLDFKRTDSFISGYWSTVFLY